MIQINFDPDRLEGAQLAWWNDWKQRAEEATREVIRLWEAKQLNPADDAYDEIFEKKSITSVWGDLKQWLLENVFHNKCAYCETDSVRAPLHAEHYRPKGRVTCKGKIVKISDQAGNEINHPGYFWLAFNWKNLVPACAWCNSGNGKKNLFPISSNEGYISVMRDLNPMNVQALKEKIIQSPTWPNIYYIQPDDLDEMEGRILLHPYFDDPRKYLRFDDFGNVIAIGNEEERIRGELSIEAYNLRDDRIVGARRREQQDAESRYENAYTYHRNNGLLVRDAKMKAKEAVVEYADGYKPYSTAVMDVLKIANPEYF